MTSLAGGVSALAMMSCVATAQNVQLEGIVVTTTKTSEAAIDTLSGSSALSRTQLDQQFQPDRPSEFLRTLPGVSTAETARDTAQSINIRGLQDFGRVNVLVEGARQSFQRSGHNVNGVYYLEPEMVKGVDITRGPTATVYGSGAIGGVAAFQLLDADDILKPGEHTAVRVRGRKASNGDGALGSATGAVKVGNFDILGQTNWRESFNYTDGAGVEIPDSGDSGQSTLMKSRWRPARGHQFTGTVIDYDSEFTDRPTATSTTRRDSSLHNSQYTLGYTFARPDEPLVDFSSKVYKVRTELDQTRILGFVFEPTGSFRNFTLETEGVDVFNTSRFRFGSVKWALTYGGDTFRDEVTTSDKNGDGDEFTPGGRRTVSGAFIQSHHTFFDTFDIIAAARYDTYELSGGTTSLEGSRTSPKVTAGVTLLKGVTVFATYAEGYRAPAVTETLISGLHPPPAVFALVPNPNLRPEVAHNVESGVNLKFDNVLQRSDAFRAKFVVFQNKVDDYIDGVQNPITLAYQYQNIANVTLEGAELEAMYDARTWFFGAAAHRIRGSDDETGAGLLSVPADRIVLTAGVRALEEKLIAGVRVHLVDEQDRVPAVIPPATSLATDGYSLLDLFGQYALNEAMTVNVNVDNVFDKNYRQHLDQSNSPGLNARVGLTMRFGAR